MGLFNEDDSKEDQKIWNLLVFKMYVTNEERDSMLPWSIGIAIIIVICIALFL